MNTITSSEPKTIGEILDFFIEGLRGPEMTEEEFTEFLQRTCDFSRPDDPAMTCDQHCWTDPALLRSRCYTNGFIHVRIGPSGWKYKGMFPLSW